MDSAEWPLVKQGLIAHSRLWLSHPHCAFAFQLISSQIPSVPSPTVKQMLHRLHDRLSGTIRGFWDGRGLSQISRPRLTPC